MPYLVTRVHPQRKQAAAFFRIRNGRLAVGDNNASEIGERHINVGSIDRRTPLHAAVYPTFSDAALPDDLYFAVGIDCVHHARFLSGDERPPPVGEKSKSGASLFEQFT